MGLFRNKNNQPKVAEHIGNKSYSQEVVGEKTYRENLIKIIKIYKAELKGEIFTKALLIPEPNNEFDSNAILVQIDGLKVGYIARSETADFNNLIKDNRIDALQVNARIGWDSNNPAALIGVQLDVSWNE